MREVIRVERLAEPATGAHDSPPDGARALIEGWDGPSIDGDSLSAIGRVADEVLPSIVARLAVSGLGEIEVRHGDWRIRVRRAATAADAQPTATGVAADPPVAAEPTNPAVAGSSSRPSTMATSPAVGYAVPRPELAVGARVAQGDVLGWIDVLGVRQEVVAPVDGLVGRWMVGPGDPVEYGQGLAQLVPGSSATSRPDPAGEEA